MGGRGQDRSRLDSSSDSSLQCLRPGHGLRVPSPFFHQSPSCLHRHPLSSVPVRSHPRSDRSDPRSLLPPPGPLGWVRRDPRNENSLRPPWSPPIPLTLPPSPSPSRPPFPLCRRRVLPRGAGSPPRPLPSRPSGLSTFTPEMGLHHRPASPRARVLEESVVKIENFYKNKVLPPKVLCSFVFCLCFHGGHLTTHPTSGRVSCHSSHSLSLLDFKVLLAPRDSLSSC